MFSADDKKTTKGRKLMLKKIKARKEIETDSHIVIDNASSDVDS